MAVREVLTYPDPRLRQAAAQVQVIGAEIDALINDMQSTLYDQQGVGLAANQIGEDKRVIVIDITAGREPGHFMAFVNPEIISVTPKQELAEEGCLSLPGIREQVVRRSGLKLRAFDRYGRPLQMEAQDFLARVIQHELDHLDGRLFTDRLGFFKRLLLRARLRRLARRK